MGLPLTMPAALRMEKLSAGKLQGASIVVKSGGAQGHILYIAGVVGDMVMIGFGASHFQAWRRWPRRPITATQLPPPEYYVWN